MHSVWKTSIRFTLVATILLGLGYPLLVTGIASVIFPHKAAGSLILKDGQVIGSELLAQSFTSDRYFHPRPSVNSYDASNSGGSNLAQSNKALVTRIQGDIDKLAAQNPGFRTRSRHHARRRPLPSAARRQGAQPERRERAAAHRAAHDRPPARPARRSPGQRAPTESGPGQARDVVLPPSDFAAFRTWTEFSRPPIIGSWTL